ncbi:2-oxoglutarate dehydrogenase subunit E1 [Thalassobaculum fulvum]|uniref:2-oxoglutarate dehydrogenase E1 component n=1 Tax=Thalassobaculum fulvum TaxID=1633335 RepID=A0A919CRA3_9PROT|nr:2-oxoglutarate dehydrogenase E1 component [Thalassobaculum fulvum]GHD58213.1 2-oxoglutarate dehydrogenase subunit E1 [Thalassobaculum fulvum]
MRTSPAADAAYLEDLYARFLDDPLSVDPSLWPLFAESADARATVRRARRPRVAAAAGDAELVRRSVATERLIAAWRTHGHLAARLDPLGLRAAPGHPELDPAAHGLGAEDMAAPVAVELPAGCAAATPGAVFDRLRDVWGGTFAAEVMHLEDVAARDWLIAAVEGDRFAEPSREERLARLDGLLAADAVEQFMNKRLPTNKRFGLEGMEAEVPMWEAMLADAAAAGVTDVVMAPMHRGRLTLITRVVGKPFNAAFSELLGTPQVPDGIAASSDVPYHLGISTDREFGGRPLRIVMPSNPSHVELVAAVSLGKARAKQDLLRAAGEPDPEGRVLPLLLHTDGAFAGQGVIAEMLQLASLPAYRVGGSVHVIANNQLAFTVKPEHGRSSRHPSDAAKAIGAPVLHVQVDDVDQVVRAGRIAMAFRAKFRRDVVVDVVGYRRRGHNELEEPMFTEPVRYARIAGTPGSPQGYADACVAAGAIDRDRVQALADRHWAALDEAFEAARGYKPNRPDRLARRWSALKPRGQGEAPATGLPLDRLRALGAATVRVPEGFELNPKIARQWGERTDSLERGEGVCFATAEALAFASLLDDGYGVRLTGQDSRRGTFSQRHAVVFDQTTGEEHTPLAALAHAPGRLTVADSPLTEEACLGFEYGASITDPDTLVAWEAQFGDFANGAQAIVDQFIVAGDDKWLRQSGLVLLLPHGLEGGGPEHSSGRVERFLQLAADGNISVLACGSPANLFHALRRQMLRPYRVPLVAFTPKSGLRHAEAVSSLAEFGPGTAFRPVIADAAVPAGARRVVLVAGKLYFELAAARRERGIDDVALVRVEELYPFPAEAIAGVLTQHPGAGLVWAQEEPENMGGWRFAAPLLASLRGSESHATYCGRPAAASPAVGWGKWHKAEYAAILDAALAPAAARRRRAS